MPKSPEMTRTLDMLSESLFGTKRSSSIENKTCVMCKQEVKEFTDDLSAQEFLISGVCQSCQDKVFGGE